MPQIGALQQRSVPNLVNALGGFAEQPSPLVSCSQLAASKALKRRSGSYLRNGSSYSRTAAHTHRNMLFTISSTMMARLEKVKPQQPAEALRIPEKIRVLTTLGLISNRRSPYTEQALRTFWPLVDTE